MTNPLSTIARPLASVARALWPHLRRMYQERQAGQMPFSVDTDVLEHGVDATLDRLCGGNIDDTWWHNLLNHIGHPFVAPDFLRMPALQEWLADGQVQSDFKALARQRIMGADEDDPEAQTSIGKSNGFSTDHRATPCWGWPARPTRPALDALRPQAPPPAAPAADQRWRQQANRRPAPPGRKPGDGEAARLELRCRGRQHGLSRHSSLS
jgi:hypothetical protein